MTNLYRASQKGGNSRFNPPIGTQAGSLPRLHLAAKSGRDSEVSDLIRKGVDVNEESKPFGQAALHFACENGHLRCAQLLLNAGAIFDGDYLKTWSPLHQAAYYGHEEIVSELIKRGANVHIRSRHQAKGRIPLHAACQNGHLGCVRLLLDAGSRVNEPDDQDNWTPLHAAAYHGHAKVVAELTKRGANVYARTGRAKHMPRDVAKQNGHYECRMILVEAQYEADCVSWYKVYEAALAQRSSVTQSIVHCITMGPSRVGKTWLKNLLTGCTNDRSIPTSDCVVPPDICIPNKETFLNAKGIDDTWVLLSAEEELRAVIYEFECLKPENLPNSIVSGPQNEVTVQRQVTTVTEDISSKSRVLKEVNINSNGSQCTEKKNETYASKKCSEKPKYPASFEEKILQFLKARPNLERPVSLKDRDVIYFTDTGGQASFHEIHPALLTAPGGIYLLVFNLKDINVENKEESRSKLDLVERALRSIYCFAVKPDEVSKVEQYMKIHSGRNADPKVFIVGTHKDEVTEDLDMRVKIANEILQDINSGKQYSRYCHSSIIPVDSTQAGKKTSQMKDNEGLLTLLKSTKDALKKIEVKIPLYWWLFHLFIRHEFETSQANDKKWVYRYDDLQKKAKSLGIVSMSSESISEFDAMVKLFHHLTFWVNFDSPVSPVQGSIQLKDMIVTDPASLYKCISKLVNIQERDGDLSFPEKSFKETGRFSEMDLPQIAIKDDQTLLSPDAQQWFLDLLIHLRIAAVYRDVKEDAQDVYQQTATEEESFYVIPAAFPYNPKVTIPDSTTVGTLRVTLEKAGFIPNGLYCKLICDLVTKRNEHINNCTCADRSKCEYQFRMPDFSRSLEFHQDQENGFRAVCHFCDSYGRVYVSESTDAILVNLTINTSSFKKINNERDVVGGIHAFCSEWWNKINRSLKSLVQRYKLKWETACPFSCCSGERWHWAEINPARKTAHCSRRNEEICLDGEDLDPSQVVWFERPKIFKLTEIDQSDCNGKSWKIIRSLDRGLSEEASFQVSQVHDMSVASGPGLNEESDSVFLDNMDEGAVTNRKRSLSQTDAVDFSDLKKKAHELNPERIINFLEEHRSRFEFCDAKKITSAKGFSRDQIQRLHRSQSTSDANNLLYQFPYDDPAPQTLLNVANALKEAPNTTNTNKNFAEIIFTFLNDQF